VIHQAAVDGDALAREVASTVLMNHALGITNLVLLFDPQLVVIGWETLILPSYYTARMYTMDCMPEFDVAGAVREKLARRGVNPPQFTHAVLEPNVVMLGAASLLVDEFLRTPPAMNT
jgi:predicted NBD/HSP70 family sugar kinase